MKESISIFRELCSKFENALKDAVNNLNNAHIKGFKVLVELANKKEDSSKFSAKPKDKKFKKDIEVIRNIRNLLSHVDCKIEGKAAIEIKTVAIHFHSSLFKKSNIP